MSTLILLFKVIPYYDMAEWKESTMIPREKLFSIIVKYLQEREDLRRFLPHDLKVIIHGLLKWNNIVSKNLLAEAVPRIIQESRENNYKGKDAGKKAGFKKHDKRRDSELEGEFENGGEQFEEEEDVLEHLQADSNANFKEKMRKNTSREGLRKNISIELLLTLESSINRLIAKNNLTFDECFDLIALIVSLENDHPMYSNLFKMTNRCQFVVASSIMKDSIKKDGVSRLKVLISFYDRNKIGSRSLKNMIYLYLNGEDKEKIKEEYERFVEIKKAKIKVDKYHSHKNGSNRSGSDAR